MLVDWRLKVPDILQAKEISHSLMDSISNDHLGMRKLSSRCVPYKLTNDRKRVTYSIECLALIDRNMDWFCVVS